MSNSKQFVYRGKIFLLCKPVKNGRKMSMVVLDIKERKKSCKNIAISSSDLNIAISKKFAS